jgi:hypothetical protein
LILGFSCDYIAKIKKKNIKTPLKRLKDMRLIYYTDIRYQYHHIVYQALHIQVLPYVCVCVCACVCVCVIYIYVCIVRMY